MRPASLASLVFLGLCLGALAFWGESGREAVSPQGRFDYHDDHDRRILADIRLDLVERDGEPSVRLVISAVGPAVAPVPGYRGVHGGNVLTAEQLDQLLSGRYPLRVVTRGPGGKGEGSVRVGKRGRLLERRLDADGRLDPWVRTERAYPLEMIVEAGPLRAGVQSVEVLVAGVPRLRLAYRAKGRDVQVLGFASLGDPRHPGGEKGENGPLGPDEPLLPEDESGEEKPPEKPLPAPIPDADWDGRDLEGKWARYRRGVAGGAEVAKAWRQYLEKRKEFAFLEMVALYGEDTEERTEAGEALARADAPQWMRVAVWLRDGSTVGHNEPPARKLIVRHAPAVALAWLEKYRKQAVRPGSLVEADYLHLKKQKLPKADVGKLLPPLEPREVFRHLDGPAKLEEFADRKKAEKGKVYDHQVLRALHGLVVSTRYEKPWTDRALLLTRHAHPRVRQQAYLAFTHFPEEVDPKNPLLDEFEPVADDAKQPGEVRKAALLAFSYVDHPRAFLKLHRVAHEPGHPGWGVAVSRLHDLGNGYTLDHLGRVPEGKLAAEDVRMLREVRTGIAGRMNSLDDAGLAPHVRPYLEQVVWAELVNDQGKEGLREHVKGLFRDRGGEKVEAELQKLARGYSPRFSLARRIERLYKDQVGVLARQILSEREGRR